MKYLLALFCFLFSISANAQEDVSLAKKIPECTDSVLMQKLKDRVSEYYANKTPDNILVARHQILVIKNMNKFKEVDITDFRPSDNYSVANLIMEKKMNSGLIESDMRLCKSDTEELLRGVYLLIYPYKDKARASLINFANDKDEFFVEIATNSLE